MRLWPVIIIFFFLGGCKVGPDYQPPENVISDEWQDQDEAISTDKPATDWWNQFQDVKLSKIIEMAAAGNKDVARAEEAILETRALRDVAASKLFPQLTSDLSYIKTYFSKNGPVFA